MENDMQSVSVRHYCQGLGDCHLLSFPRRDGGEFIMLIDCGVHTSVKDGAQRVRDIAEDIRERTKHIDVLVLTHEHWDHLSGFYYASEIFKDITIGEVWMAWTENPDDPQAREIDKFKGEVVQGVEAASAAMAKAGVADGVIADIGQGLAGIFGFNFGIKGERVRTARDRAAALGGRRLFLEPGTAPMTLAGVEGVRVYVLGPPREKEMLRTAERASEMFQHLGLGAAGRASQALRTALGVGVEAREAEDAAPFDPEYGVDLEAALAGRIGDRPKLQALLGCYTGAASSRRRAPETKRVPMPEPDDCGDEEAVKPAEEDQEELEEEARFELDPSWRRIDHDYLMMAADLALQLDNYTNNTSLVLAFEFVDSGRVMLFPADAQIGNWLSWQALKWRVDGCSGGPTEVTAADLLSRTVYLKVAHHGSHNASPKQKGLELMTSPDLAAFIPTHKEDAMKVRWGEMPFGPVLKDLAGRAANRVVRADDPWIGEEAGRPATFTCPSGSIRNIRHKKGLWVELDIA